MLSVAAAVFVLLVPGYCLAHLLWSPKAVRERMPFVEGVFCAAALSVLVSALCAHSLAVAGVFTSARFFAVLAGVTLALVAACLAARRSLCALSFAGKPSTASSSPSAFATALLHDVAPFALVGVLLAIYYPPTQFLWGSADEGVYSNAALQIVHAGELVYRDEVLDSLPAALMPVNEGVHARGFHFLDSPAIGGAIVPHGFHLLPSWLAALHVAGGEELLFAGPIALTLIAVLGLYLLAARFGGPLAGLLAAGLLGVDPASVWFARVTNAEGMTEMLLVSGFALLALGVPARASEEPSVERRAHAGRLFAAGLLLGAVHLAKVEFFLLPWAVLLSAVLLLAASYRARDAAALPLGYALTLALATFHAFHAHRMYFRVQLFNPETYGVLNAILFVGSFAAAILGAVLVFAWRRELPRLARFPVRRAVIALGAFTVLLAVYLYWGLPLQSEWGEAAPEELATWQRALALPPEYVAGSDYRTWREFTFRLLGLYLSTLGVFCGVVGVFLLLLRKECLPLAPFLCMVLVQTAFFLLVSGKLDYGSANPHTPGRRFLSLTIPGFALAAALPWFVYARGAPRRTAFVLRGLGVAVCGLCGYAAAKTASPLAHNPVWTETADSVRELASHGDESVVWIVPDDDGVGIRWVAPLYFLARQKLFMLSRWATVEQADALLSVLRQHGWTPVLLLGKPPGPDRSPGELRMIEVLGAEGRASIPVSEYTVAYRRHRMPSWSDFFLWETELACYGKLPNP